MLELSGSVGYDPLKKLLYARCASIKANVATLVLSMKIAMGQLGITQIKNLDL